jgi:hypothetical protein
MVLRCPLPLLGFRIQDFHFLWLLIPKYSPIRKEWLLRILQHLAPWARKSQILNLKFQKIFNAQNPKNLEI